MSKHSRRFSRLSLALLTLLAAVIVVLPVVVSNMHRQPTDPSIVPLQVPAPSRFAENVNRSLSSLEQICFVRGAWIYLADSKGKETRLVEGASPHLAPAGESLVFVSVKENEGTLNRVFPPANRLSIMNLRTREIHDFNALRSSRTGVPIWSNDSARIAVVATDSDSSSPYIAVLNPSTGLAEKKITGGWDPLTPDEGIYIDSWTPDDQSLLFHTLSALYEVRLRDALVEKIPVGEVFQSGAISSATQFSFSSDRRYLLFDSMVDSPEEPETAVISIFDFTSKALHRITPKPLQGRAPVWLPSDKEILFTRVEWAKTTWRTSVCKIAIDGTGLSTLVPDADYGSYSTR